MTDGNICAVNNYPRELNGLSADADPRKVLLAEYKELLMERVIISPDGKEINGRLTDLLQRAQEDAREQQCDGEPFSRAVVRHALRRLNYAFTATTLGGIPAGPAYERSIPSGIAPQQVGREKVNYPMSQYPDLSYLPVGGLGAPLCEIDYATCYVKEGMMIQDKPIRKLTVEIAGKTYDLSEIEGTYSALYPFSERQFDLPIPFSVVQFSPVIPGDYQAASLPVEIMEVVAENTTDQPITLTFTISQENLLGWYPKKVEDNPRDPRGLLVWDKQSKGNYSEAFSEGEASGVIFKKEGSQKDFIRVGEGVAGQVAILSRNVSGKVVITPVISKTRKNTAGLTLSITLQPGEKIQHPVVIAFDTPFYNFQLNAADPKSYGTRMPKFYTRYYDATGQNAAKMAGDALHNCNTWKKQVIDFQAAILNDPELPDFFKQALLNELYILTETGIWEADQGRFAYLESIDYKMYNTSDVNSYTWATLILFPELERKDILELARLVPLSDPRRRWWGTDRWANIPPEQWKHLYWAPVKDAGAVCHDLGGLLGQGIFPFTNTCNEFDWSNADMWIDLAPKFVLRSMRYVAFMREQTGVWDFEFIKQIYPAAKLAMDTLERRWGDKETHVPISKGIPDWTYDTISGQGFTPNVVSQWLAALEAMSIMATVAEDPGASLKYFSWQKDGKPAMEQLWNEKGYYNAFLTPDGVEVNENVHSDMLFGAFYARMCGIAPVVPDDKAAQALGNIYRVNGMEWSAVGGHGPLGLVNLRGPNGEQNKTEQGDEGWTGTMLLNAAYQIKLGLDTHNPQLVQNGWNIVQGFFNVVYSQSPDSQHWFGRTPEGYANPDDERFNAPGRKYENETGRAPKYMRALAIWAVYAAVKGNKMPFNFYGEKIPDPADLFPHPFGK